MFWKGRATQWTSFRALRGSEGYGVCEDAARRAFLDHRCNDNTQNVTTCFFARKRYFASPAPLFCILFSGKTEKSMPAERQLQRRCKNGTVGAFGKAHQQSPRQGGKNPQKARGKFDIPVRKMRKLALVFSRSIRYNIRNSRSFGGLKE